MASLTFIKHLLFGLEIIGGLKEIMRLSMRNDEGKKMGLKISVDRTRKGQLV